MCHLNQNVRIWKIVHSRDCGKMCNRWKNLYDKMVVRGIEKPPGLGSIVGLRMTDNLEKLYTVHIVGQNIQGVGKYVLECTV